MQSSPWRRMTRGETACRLPRYGMARPVVRTMSCVLHPARTCVFGRGLQTDMLQPTAHQARPFAQAERARSSSVGASGDPGAPRPLSLQPSRRLWVRGLVNTTRADVLDAFGAHGKIEHLSFVMVRGMWRCGCAVLLRSRGVLMHRRTAHVPLWTSWSSAVRKRRWQRCIAAPSAAPPS